MKMFTRQHSIINYQYRSLVCYIGTVFDCYCPYLQYYTYQTLITQKCHKTPLAFERLNHPLISYY